jgi:cholesterol oxidase
MSDSFDVDFLVVGSGFGGSVSALRLVEKGYTVRVLERGARFAPEDFPKTNWDMRKSLWLPLAKCFGILRLSLFSDVFILSGAGVGGGSLVYANTLYVPPDAFFAAPQWAGMQDWKAALLPHYRMAQYMLGVTQNTFEGEPDRLLHTIAKKMNRESTYVRTPVAVYFGGEGGDGRDPYFNGQGPARTGCTLCGGCMVGCRYGAKNTLDKNYLYFAEKSGAVVEPMRTVTDVRALPGGGYAVTHQRSGAWFAKDRKVVRARNVVLSAGVLGTVKLLLECKERGSLPNVSPCLGERVRTNSEAILGVTTEDRSVAYSKGIAITTSFHPDEDTHVEVVRYSEGSDALAPLATLLTDGGPGLPRPLKYVKNVLTQPLTFLRSIWPFGKAKRGIFLLVMQTLDNSISLKLKRKWTRLFRRAFDTDRGSGAATPTYIPLGNEVARAFAGSLKGGIAYSSIPEVLFDIPTTAHILGGAPIGDSPERGVIDIKNEVFGHPGLFVCDGSSIPANLGVNPSLTITALTEHAMSQVPVKEGATLTPAIDAAWTAARLAEIEARALALGSPSLQEKNGEAAPLSP